MNRVALLALVFPALLALSPAHSEETADRLKVLIEKNASSIVQVKAIIKLESMRGGQSRDRERRVQMLGVVVDAEGLILVPSHQFASEGDTLKRTALDIKVIFNGEEKEYGAFVAALDSKLNLAFLKVEALADRKLQVIGFDGAAEPGIGQQVAAVGRLPKGFDFAPYFETGRINGLLAKPRKSWILEGDINGYGLPVFALDGQVLGILSTVASADEEEGGSGMFTRQLRVVLPGALVKGVIDQAKKQAVEVAAERAKQAAEGGGEPKTKGEAEKGGEPK